MQQDILRAYQLSDDEQAKTAATALDTEQAVLQLEEMLGRIQVNNYKIEQFEQQEQQIGQEIAAKQSVADSLREQICRYLTQLTGREIPPEELAADKVPFKSLRESVNQARRLRTEMQRADPATAADPAGGRKLPDADRADQPVDSAGGCRL